MTLVEKIDWKKVGGKIPAIIQNNGNQEFLMLGYQNMSALKKTLKEGQVTFYSRTKKRLWTKGETSGHFLKVIDVHLDCDHDTLLYKVEPLGPTCHEGTQSCFSEFDLSTLEEIISRKKGGYTEYLLKKEDGLYRKVTEEATEVLLAAKNDDSQNLIEEISDLFYHVLVVMKKKKITLADIYLELHKRNKGLSKTLVV